MPRMKSNQLSRGLEALIRIIAGRTARFMCSRRQNLIDFPSLCWKALNRWGSNASQTRTVA